MTVASSCNSGDSFTSTPRRWRVLALGAPPLLIPRTHADAVDRSTPSNMPICASVWPSSSCRVLCLRLSCLDPRNDVGPHTDRAGLLAGRPGPEGKRNETEGNYSLSATSLHKAIAPSANAWTYSLSGYSFSPVTPSQKSLATIRSLPAFGSISKTNRSAPQ